MKFLSASLTCLFLFPPVVLPQEQSPLEVVRTSNQAVQSILKSGEAIDSEKESELLSIINGVTAFDSISRRVTERFCKNLTPDQCERFNSLFRRLLRVSSINKMGRYRAESFEYLGEEITENTAVVKTIAYYEDENIHLDYHLERVQGRWKVHNYVVDDVNTIRNYSKQFVRLFSRNSYETVMGRLERKIVEYENEY